jgi:hypothetical protein
MLFCLSAARANRRPGRRFCQVIPLRFIPTAHSTRILSALVANLRFDAANHWLGAKPLFGLAKFSDAAQAAVMQPER